MTVIARKIKATPARSASAAWKVVVDLISAKDSNARADLEAVSGIASSLISDEAFSRSPGVVYGTGPRVRIYCLYDDDAITGDKANENALTFNPTEGEWQMSLPCPAEDLAWVQGELKKKSTRITARDESADVDEENDVRSDASAGFEINREVFLKS
jgi:hypothetical protein